MKVVWSPLAIKRVLEAADYIARDSPGAAKKWARSIFDAAARLEALSGRGRVVPEAGRPEIRELLVGRYRVIYRMGEEDIAILTVRHGRRLLDLQELEHRSDP